MPQTQATYGFGFSPISLENKDKAFADEMFAVKHLGLTGILYGDSKNPVSATVYNRRKQSLEKFINEMQSRNLVGDLYTVFPDNNVYMKSTAGGIGDSSGANMPMFSEAVNINTTKKPLYVYVYTDSNLVNDENHTILEDMSGVSVYHKIRVAVDDDNENELTMGCSCYCTPNNVVKICRNTTIGEEDAWNNANGSSYNLNFLFNYALNLDFYGEDNNLSLSKYNMYTYGAYIYIVYEE